jgi:zinc/manganese transport system permease protein
MTATTVIAASIVAAIAGTVGFFVVLRGSAFVAHAIPHGSFGGAAGAALIAGVDGTILGVNATIVGLFVFAVAGAIVIGWLGRRRHHDVATALTLVLMLGIGALFLSWSSEYESAVYSLLFGEVFGVAPSALVPIAVLGALSVGAMAVVFRPLLLSSLAPEVAQARGIRLAGMETAFLLVVALATTMTVPVVGALLMFSLMVGPPAAARVITARPQVALALSAAIALALVWAGLLLADLTDWPLGFFVGLGGAVCYLAGRAWKTVQSRRAAGVEPPAGLAAA